MNKFDSIINSYLSENMSKEERIETLKSLDKGLNKPVIENRFKDIRYWEEIEGTFEEYYVYEYADEGGEDDQRTQAIFAVQTPEGEVAYGRAVVDGFQDENPGDVGVRFIEEISYSEYEDMKEEIRRWTNGSMYASAPDSNQRDPDDYDEDERD